MTHILHIDTSGPTGLVFLAADGQLVAVRRNEQERDHASGINAMVASVLAEGDISLTDLSAIAVCGGPGSYTGLRIGLATAKGYCFALDIPLILHDRLMMLAWQGRKDAPSAELYVSLLQARVDEYFIAVYDNKVGVTSEPRHYRKEEVAALFESYHSNVIAVIGDSLGSEVLSGERSSILYLNHTQIEPEVWAEESVLSWTAQEFTNISQAEPFYLKSVFIAKKK